MIVRGPEWPRVRKGDDGGGHRVRSRSNRRPIFVALGTATVLTLGAVAGPAAAFAADPSPTAGEDPTPDPTPTSPEPSSPPSSDPPPSTPKPPATPAPPRTSPPYQPPPSLSVRLSLSATRAAPGGSVTATARVGAQRAVARHAVLRISASGATVVGGTIALGDVSAAHSAAGVVRIPAGHAPGKITVTASLSADRASTRTADGTITVTGGATSSGSSSSGGGGVDLPPSVPVPGLPGTAAAVSSGAADARLPLIAGQDPAVAPDPLPPVRPVSLRTRTTALGLDAISYRLLWTQVAWLTALLVGVSLLLTQLRLNRRRLAARRTARR
jgi:hypothetical protein